MKPNAGAFFLLLFLVGCSTVKGPATSATDPKFRVISFTQGKMVKEGQSWRISEPSSTLVYEDTGRCVFNGELLPCMWHGFTLEYDSHGQDVELDCHGSQNLPADVGDPTQILKEQSTEFDYAMPLSGLETTFTNPQYTTRNPTPGKLRKKTICRLDGKPVLKWNQTIVFPDELYGER